MPLVAAAMMPHGFSLPEPIRDDAGGALATRQAMRDVGRRFAEASVEAIVLLGPHGTRVDGAMCVMDVGRVAGTLTYKGASVEMNVPCDRALIGAIRDAASAAGVPVAMTGFGGNRADQSVAPLDWGGLVPLWFLGHDDNEPGSGDVLAPVPGNDHGPSVVLITPSRSLSHDMMVRFGQALADVFARDARNIALVASCDWAHTHAAHGPYGFHPAAERVDRFVVDAVTRNDLHALASLSSQDVTDAAIDGLWQSLILAGVQDRTPLDVEVLRYEAPDYYGMIVAAYRPGEVAHGNG